MELEVSHAKQSTFERVKVVPLSKNDEHAVIIIYSDRIYELVAFFDLPEIK
jgi:hypothetical protein